MEEDNLENKTENLSYVIRHFKREVEDAWRAVNLCYRHRIAYSRTYTNSSLKLK